MNSANNYYGCDGDGDEEARTCVCLLGFVLCATVPVLCVGRVYVRVCDKCVCVSVCVWMCFVAV